MSRFDYIEFFHYYCDKIAQVPRKKKKKTTHINTGHLSWIENECQRYANTHMKYFLHRKGEKERDRL